MEQRQCTGDCLNCIPIQRQYCTAQFTYNTMRMVEAMADTVTQLKDKIDAIQGNEATLIPVGSQEGDGVVEPQSNQANTETT